MVLLKEFFKINNPVKQDHGTYQFLVLFLAAERLENVGNGKEICTIPFQMEKEDYL